MVKINSFGKKYIYVVKLYLRGKLYLCCQKYICLVKFALRENNELWDTVVTAALIGCRHPIWQRSVKMLFC